ncbi:hypothetical protein W97_02946 [Coniosporium apollinis CBS 100218]|uniref:Exocyst complex protein EXO70 n=1 Tax=Coniosporium apollinis (strain CBS 100218) TaxID=1168221 RepID=R7YPE8_CONA1|nr:uncharacterized protein W97_02946 [Coniosporium apollinis CBS 100218]EON63718.1 hypothetical protein W97_02946 [Coniosporium apollinis CBS 100218]
MVAPRKAAYAEESAEVEVLLANMEKLKGLTKKIQGSLNRLEMSGKSVQDAIGPIYGNTQRLQTTNSNVDRIIEAIDRIREPLDQRNREERIIRAGPRKVGMAEFIASLDRTTDALRGLRHSNLRSNQQAISELNTLLKMGTKQLEDVFREILSEGAHPVEPLHYITKQLPFPGLPQESASQLKLINTHVSASVAQISQADFRETPTARTYAEIRGDYITTTLRNLAAASMSTAKKTTADAIYRRGTNGVGTYAQGMEGLYVTEYENVRAVFTQDEWSRVFKATCQGSLNEFSRTLRELNTFIQHNLMTDCFLAYEIIEIVSTLSLRLEGGIGELKRPIADSLKPIRETAMTSLVKLLEDTRTRVQSLVALPMDGSPIPATNEVMTRLQTMTSYLPSLSSILTSLGDGGWSITSASTSSTSIPTIKSFEVGADGRKLFAHYASDTLNTLLQNIDAKSRMLHKTKPLQGVFIANNVAVINRMIRNSDLQPLLAGWTGKVDEYQKKSTDMYMDAWQETSKYLLDVQYTNRGARPPSGTTGSVDSAALIKSLGSKDKDAIKEKFRNFNASFEDLVAKHKSYRMEKEVKAQLMRDVQAFMEPLYGRFWDRYHEIDKGKGKYVKYTKDQFVATLAGLA